jgi:purine-binding chemotaxis protein CheW
MTDEQLPENQDAASDPNMLTAGRSQFISFKIGEEEYAIDIMAVREIKGWSPTTTLPSQPSYVRGVMNLRGAIIPIFDLRRRFDMGVTNASASHVVIVVAVQDRHIGLLVDAVSDILTIETGDIRPVPDSNSGENVDFLAGIVSIKESMVVIISLDKLFARAAATGAPPSGLQLAAA